MAVQSDTSSISYTGNNSTTTSYTVPFVFLENSHLAAIAKVTATGVETPVTLVDHIGAGNSAGGNVRTAVAVPATSTLTIFRTVPATQTTSYQEGGDFPAASHERALDKLTMLCQQIARSISRTVRLSDAAPETEALAVFPNRFFGTDENGNIAMVAGTDAAAGSITEESLANGAVTTPKIASGAVTEVKLSDGAVTGSKISDAAVTSAKIANGSTTTEKLADGSVSSQKIANGAVTTLKIADAVVSAAKLTSETQQGLVPAGAVMPFAMSSAPSGWLAANGAAVSRSTYSALFAAIGTAHGSGDGSTTFNLPDLRGIFVRGSGTQTISGTTYSGTFAAKENDALKSHAHTRTTGAEIRHTLTGGPTNVRTGWENNGTTDLTGSTETRPANIALLYCVKF